MVLPKVEDFFDPNSAEGVCFSHCTGERFTLLGVPFRTCLVKDESHDPPSVFFAYDV